MATNFDHYCHSCGGRGDRRNPRCEACGTVRALNKLGLIARTAFVLNELRAWPMADVLTAQQRARVETFYEDQMSALTTAPGAAAVAMRVPAAPASQTPIPAPRRAPVAPRPLQPKKEMDWSWLTQQQANLFLFAGAFLTVIAALIYVGYSGEAVSGALKMTLLAFYTGAFLVGGAICLRIPRVEMAGRVFFAIGSVLVPINFVAARTLAEDSNLNPETLWLTGSIMTAAFWTSVAYLGLGRAYSFGGGGALISAVLAFVVRVEMPAEWIPAAFVALATLMSLTSIIGQTTLRSRIGEIWTYQAHAVALFSVVFAVAVAMFTSGGIEYDLATRWFLPLTFAGFAAYALLQMAATREQPAAIAAIVGFGAAFIAIGYAVETPAETYVVLAAALAVTFGAIMLAATNAPKDAPLAPQSDLMLRWAAMISTGIALVIALLVLQLAAEPEVGYTVRTRWFLPATFALIAVFYAIDAFIRRERSGAIALLAALTGIAASTTYALNVSAEYYAFALVLPAVAFAAIARWANHPLLDRLDAAWRDDTVMVGYAALASGLAVAGVAAAVSAAEDPAIDPAFRAYLPFAFVAAAAFATIDATRNSRIGVVTLAVALAGIGAGVVYALDTSGEMYAFGLLIPAILIAAAVRFAPNNGTSWLPTEWRDDAIIVGRGTVGAGIAVAIAALGVAEDRTPNTYEPLTPWFLTLAFTGAAAFFALDASRGKREDITACLLASIGAAIVSVPYALDASAEYYGVALAVMGALFAIGGRAYTPAWIDERVRDVAAVIAVTASWLLFEGAYVDAPRVGAAVHFAAAAFYLGAALTDRSKLTLEGLLEVPAIDRVRVASAWLYAAGLTAVIGYVFVLRSLPGSENAEGGSMAASFAFAAIAFALAGAAAKQWRPEFSIHLYVMALAVALVSLATGGDAGTMTVILGVYVVTFAAIAAYENQPLLAAPSVLFGFAAVATWREYAGADWALVPTAYCAIGAIAGAAAVALTDSKRWAQSIAATAALFLAAAPVVGIGLLMSQTEASRSMARCSTRPPSTRRPSSPSPCSASSPSARPSPSTSGGSSSPRPPS